MKPTVELTASDTILANPVGSVEVGGVTYDIMPPTTATLIAASALISQLPEIQRSETSEQILREVIVKASDCGETLGQIAATLILGQKRISEQPMVDIAQETAARKWSWRKFRRITETKTTLIPVYERDHLAGQLLQTFTPGDLSKIIYSALSTDTIADFFVLTASLSTKNLLKKTKTEAEPATASGHSS